MSLAILFHFLCVQHVSYINMSIIRSLQLFCWITTLVVLFLVRCLLEIRYGWVGVVSVLQAEVYTDTTPTQPHRISNRHRTKKNTTNVVIQQNSRKRLMMDILMSETCWAHKRWNQTANYIQLVFYSSTITMMHGRINIKYTTPVFEKMIIGLCVCDYTLCVCDYTLPTDFSPWLQALRNTSKTQSLFKTILNSSSRSFLLSQRTFTPT